MQPTGDVKLPMTPSDLPRSCSLAQPTEVEKAKRLVARVGQCGPNAATRFDDVTGKASVTVLINASVAALMV